MGRFIIWHNLNNNTYYYKYVKGMYYNYKIGLINQYNHEVILIIDLSHFIKYKKTFVDYKRICIKNIQRMLDNLI